jgi:small-conductance mechanosensitive channel
MLAVAHPAAAQGVSGPSPATPTSQDPAATPPPQQEQVGEGAAASPLERVQARLDAARAELTQGQAALRRRNLSQTELQDLRARVDPVMEGLREIVADIGPRVDAAKNLLEQLGPKPKDGAAEGVDVARDRAEREAAVARLDDTQRVARALLAQAEQLTTQISDRRRTAFASALFERSYSLVSPDLWVSAATSIPRDLKALQIVVQDAASRFQGRSSPATLTLLGLAIGAAVAFHIARRHIAPRLVRRSAGATEVNKRRKVRTALGILLFEAAPAAGGSFVVYQLLLLADLFPGRLYPVLAALLGGLAFIAFARGATDAILAPDRPAWRLAPMSDGPAGWTATFAVAFATTIITGKVLEALNQTIAAGLPLTIATRAVVVFVAAGLLAELLRRFAVRVETDDSCLGPYVSNEPALAGPARLLGWGIVAAVVVGLLGGYVAFASFLIDQVAWIGSLAVLLYVGVALTDEFLGETLRSHSRISTTLQANLGLRRRALEQLGTLGAGIARVVLFLVVALLALAPWGVESGDFTSNLRAAFFGFQVGDVTISLSTIFIALLLFGGVIGATRIIQRWLSNTFLPTTELDAGLRNSIQTAAGYLGFFGAAALSLSYLGLGLEKIAIVAGALSVGIGFGLQSIVNNFVSGLILLWERPIRVGDLVVIGDGEGYVRRISVRATEIETYDRSSVIIPNSNLISGVVKNRVRGDRTGRVIISIGIGRDKDPTRTAELLIEQASQHGDILHEPPPRVLFKTIGGSSLDLDLVCYVDDVTKQARVQSDLNFAVFKTLVHEGIIPMPGPGAMNIGGLDQIQAALQQIAAAIAAEERGGAERGRPAPDHPLRPAADDARPGSGHEPARA